LKGFAMNIISCIRSWFQKEQEKLRPLTWKQKISYVASYYTGWFVLFLIICLFVGFIMPNKLKSRRIRDRTMAIADIINK